MISSTELHNAYNDLYKQMRRYIWSINTVQILASLEVAVYKAFPDESEVRKCYDALYRDIKGDIPRDEDTEDFYKSFDEFEDTLNNFDSIYNDIYVVSEVLVNENNEEHAEGSEEGEWLGTESEESDREEDDDTEEVDTF